MYLDEIRPWQASIKKRVPYDGVAGHAKHGWALALRNPGVAGQMQLRYEAGPTSQINALGAFGAQQCHYILFMMDGGVARFYLDGVNLIGNIGVGGTVASDADLILVIPDVMSEPLVGRLDKVALWDRTLTPEEVATLYNGGLGFTLSPPVAAPEPASLVLVGVGLAGLAPASWSRPRRKYSPECRMVNVE